MSAHLALWLQGNILPVTIKLFLNSTPESIKINYYNIGGYTFIA